MSAPRTTRTSGDVRFWSAIVGSYWRALAQYGFSESDCHALTSAVMRRLKGQLGADGFTEKEMMIRVYEELGLTGNLVSG
jgi:hypothetical protein